MNLQRLGYVAVVVLGGLAIALGVVAGLVLSPRPSPGGPQALGIVVVVLALVVGSVKALRTLLGQTDSPPPWTDAGSIVDAAPERTPGDDRISGTSLRPAIDAAGKRARSTRSVEEGLTAVRPPLREVLESALVQAGRDPEEAETALANGSWTDDQVAAAVLDDDVAPPERSFPRRAWAWLFPERAVRERTARAVGAVAEAADEALPPVVGQDAARPVPVVTPTLEDLRRTADGRLQRAEAVGAGRGESDGRREGWNLDATDGRVDLDAGERTGDAADTPDSRDAWKHVDGRAGDP